jgi:hypothetical protein
MTDAAEEPVHPDYSPGNNVIPVEHEPEKIFLSDLLNEVSVVQQKESQDRSNLGALANFTTEFLRQKLIPWAQLGCPSFYKIHTIPIVPPTTCSDGQSRRLDAYVTYLMNMPMADVMTKLRNRLPDIDVAFATTGPEILILVSTKSSD